MSGLGKRFYQLEDFIAEHDVFCRERLRLVVSRHSSVPVPSPPGPERLGSRLSACSGIVLAGIWWMTAMPPTSKSSTNAVPLILRLQHLHAGDIMTDIADLGVMILEILSDRGKETDNVSQVMTHLLRR